MTFTLRVLSGLLLYLLSSQRCFCQDNSDIGITLGVEYANEKCDINLTAPLEMSLSFPSGSTALDVMERAVMINSYYKIVLTFIGDKGYVIDSINGTQSGERCGWHLFVVVSNITRTLSQLHRALPDSVTSVVLHYTTKQSLVEPVALKPRIGVKNMTVYYTIEYEDACNNGIELKLQPLSIVISEGDTALHVLENAVHITNDSQYHFTSTYYSFGYHVHTINGTSDIYGEEVVCYWSFLIKEPNSKDRVPSQVGVDSYVIPGENYTIIMRYTDEFHPTDDNSGSSSGMQHTPFSCVVLLAMMIILSKAIFR